MKQHIVRIALGLLVVLVFLGHAAKFYQIGFVNQVDNIIYDARLRFTMPGTVDERVVILDIDEKSLAIPELGRWPWGRDRIAQLVEKLFDKYGVVIIGFDVVFAEADESSGLKVLDQLAKKELSGVPQYVQTLNQPQEYHHPCRIAAAVDGASNGLRQKTEAWWDRYKDRLCDILRSILRYSLRYPRIPTENTFSFS